MELLYSYKFWKQLAEKYELTDAVLLCSVDTEFEKLWNEEKDV